MLAYVFVSTVYIFRCIFMLCCTLMMQPNTDTIQMNQIKTLHSAFKMYYLNINVYTLGIYNYI